ncbi:YceD family protein [Thiocystis violacea]|uniref:YceD family protein n=1 Tax=Thiocystis violacea TaxID=13725 RepID=UPI001A933DA1
MVIPDDGEYVTRVDYRVVFERDVEGRPVVHGLVRSRLRLPCQRCLSDVRIDVESPLRLVLVRTDEAAAALDADFDPLVVSDDSIQPIDLIEDELLLAIPPFPRHALGGCGFPDASEDANFLASDRGLASGADGADDSVDSGGPPNPFAILETLRREK